MFRHLTNTHGEIIDEELSQAKARLVYLFLGVSYLIWLYYWMPSDHSLIPSFEISVQIVSLYALYSVVIFVLILRRVGHQSIRRITSIAADMSTCSGLLLNLGEPGAIFYPLYLWVIIGNGMRFGERYLWLAYGFGVVGFITVITQTEYWLHNQYIAIGLLFGILVLPLFFLVLVQRLQYLNRRLEEQLNLVAHAADHDSLTGLVNRRLFMEHLNKSLARARRCGCFGAVFYVDLDNFKRTNDSLGHAAGDQLLIELSKRIYKTVREEDVAARIGGDEFVILIPELDCEKDKAMVSARNYAERITAVLKRPVTIDGQVLQVGASIGITLFSADEKDATQILRNADDAMYRAKANGRNRWQFFLATTEGS